MEHYEGVLEELRQRPRRWLVTGAAGFIGSHLVERLLELGQWVRGVDNFSTGHPQNVIDVVRAVGSRHAARLEFIEADIRHRERCAEMVDGVEVVLHQAALGSVPRSITEPLATHGSNVDGFVNVLDAMRERGVRRMVYASSSSVYGDEPSDEKVEQRIGRALSPYATSKLVDEHYADVFARVYGLELAALRYFNVFGPRQDPNGPYAAVIPRWTRSLLAREACVLYGDGGKTRDFCYVDNVVQANLLAALAPPEALLEPVFNIACGAATRLDALHAMISQRVAELTAASSLPDLVAEPARAGDIANSLANIDRAQTRLGYVPRWGVAAGLTETVRWFAAQPVAPRERPSGLLVMRGAELLEQAG
jgi:UDP-N-acetylglucosamine/UDP-N-acetylgalactosamine 4-epimerase